MRHRSVPPLCFDWSAIENDTTHLGHDILAMTAVKQVEPLKYTLSSDRIKPLDGVSAERWFSRLETDEGTDVIAR